MSLRHKPVVLSESIVARSRFFEVQERSLRFRSGEELCIERLLDHGQRSVAIVAMLDEERFVLVEEYAAGIHAFVRTVPMGGVGAAETIEEAVRRELAEEIGYTAREVTVLQTLSIVPSHLGHTITVCVATGLQPADAVGDEPEYLVPHTFPMSRLYDLVIAGDVVEARSVAALYIARDWLKERHGPDQR